MTAPTIPASESVRQKQPAQQSNQPEQPRRKHDRLITRDMALVMLATFCFMSSNMLANPIVAGYAESLGADGMLMGAVAGSMSFISLFCRPIAGNLSDKTSKRTLVAVGTVLYFAAGLLYYFANSPIMLIMVFCRQSSTLRKDNRINPYGTWTLHQESTDHSPEAENP